MHVYVFVCVHTHVRARGQHRVFFNLSLLYFLSEDPFTEPGAHQII